MRISKRAKYALALPVFVVATVVAQFTHAIPTYAATLTWTAGGDGQTFSDGANWSTGSAPVNGDVVTFDITNMEHPDDVFVENDIEGLTLAGINFVGTPETMRPFPDGGPGGWDTRFHIAGYSRPITLTGDITNSMSYTSSYLTPMISADLVLADDISIGRVALSQEPSVNVGTHQLTFTSGQQCGLTQEAVLSGSGTLALAGDSLNLSKASPNFTGPIVVTGKVAVVPGALGSASAGTTVNGDGALTIVTDNDATIAEPLTFNTNEDGYFAGSQFFIGCAGGDTNKVTLTTTGPVTLQSDLLYGGDNHFKIAGAYNANGHRIGYVSGVANLGTVTTPSGQVAHEYKEIVINYDNDAIDDQYQIGPYEIGIVQKTNGVVMAQNGGVIKGTGYAAALAAMYGGVIAPGNSPGALTAKSVLVLSDGGILQTEIQNKDAYDQVVVGEDFDEGDFPGMPAVNLTGAKLDTVLYDGWNVTKGDSYTIIDNRSDTDVEGTFDGLEEGAQFTVNGITFSITYTGGDGNDVVLTALTTGAAPATPNTGALQFVKANPAIVAVFGVLAAGLLVAIAIRRRSQQ